MHCAGTAKGDGEKTRNLVRGGRAGGARHLVYISVVGADRVPVVSTVDRAMFGYFESKLAAERVVAESGAAVDDAARHPVPRPAADDGAGDGEAAGDPGPVRVPGPAGRHRGGGGAARGARARRAGRPRARHRRPAHVRDGATLVRSYLEARRKHRALVPLRLPGQAARAFRAGANLAPDRAVGRRTWEGFLAEQVG